MSRIKTNDMVFIIVYTLFLHASVYSSMLDEYITYRNLYMILLVLMNLVIRRRLSNLFGNLYCNLWYIMSVIIMISVFPHHIGQGLKIMAVPVCYYVVLQYDESLMKNISLAAVINGLWILIQSLQEDRVLFKFFYAGIYDNPNAFGASMAVLFVAACSMFILSGTMKTKVLYCMVALMAFYYICLSYSRTALLASLVVFLAMVIASGNLRENRAKMIGIILFFVVASLVCFFRYDEIMHFVYDHVYKWGNATESLSSGRTDMWKYVLNHPTLLGTLPAFSPHNNFILVFYDYGVLAGGIFVLFCFSIVYRYVLLYFKDKNNQHDLIALLFILLFICIGMFEESFGFTGKEWMCLGFLGFGHAIQKLKTDGEKSRIVIIRWKKG